MAPSSPHVRSALAAVALTALLSGCGAITDPSSVAQVGPSTLGTDELEALLVTDADGPVTAPSGQVVEVLNTWIITEILEEQLAAGGVAVTDADRTAAAGELEAAFGQEWSLTTPPARRDLEIRQTAAITVWSLTDDAVLDGRSADELYTLGPSASGVTCSSHILVDTEAEAREVLELLESGADFAELATERSTDSGSASTGGFLGCQSTGEFQQRYVPEYVEAVLTAPLGTPVGPVATEFGHHVILVPDYEAVSDEPLAELLSAPQARFGRAADAADVTVDPRYGTFDPARGVVPLG